MAIINSHTLLITMLLIASFSSLSHGLIINGNEISVVKVRGVLYCSFNGNPLQGANPLYNANVHLTCGGASTTLGQAVTDPAGAFTIVVKILDTILFDPSRCFVRLNLPVGSCAVFPPDGVLTATVRLVDVIQAQLGWIAEYVVNDFIWSVL